MKLDIDGYPTTCAICGKPVVKSRGGSVHQLTTSTGTAQSWHIPCRYPKETTMSDTTTEPATTEPTIPLPVDPDPPAEPDEPDPDDDSEDNDEEGEE